MRVGYELAIIFSYPSASRIIDLLKTPTTYREFFPTLFVKTTDFQLVLNFEQTSTATIFGQHGMMAEPIRALELHYATIQFLIIMIMIIIAIMMIINLCFGVQSDSVELLSSLNLSCPHSVSRFTLDNLYQ